MMGNYRKIYEQYYGVKIPKGYHIHHKDMNHDNDDPLNLEMLPADEHAQRHGFSNIAAMAYATGSERAIAALRTPEIRLKMKNSMVGSVKHRISIDKRSKNEEWKENVSAACRLTAKNRTNPPWNKGKCGVQPVSQETRDLWKKQRLGRIWVTNGVVSKFIYPSSVPEGFSRGRTR